MQLKLHDHTCNNFHLSDFQSPSIGYDNRVHDAHELSFNTFKKQIYELIDENDSDQQSNKLATEKSPWTSSRCALFPKCGIVTAITGDYQVETEKHLAKLGFSSFGPVSKLKHSSKVTLWFITCDDLCRNLGYVSPHDPRTAEERGY